MEKEVKVVAAVAAVAAAVTQSHLKALLTGELKVLLIQLKTKDHVVHAGPSQPLDPSKVSIFSNIILCQT